MKSISTIALAVSLAIGGASFAAPASAQKKAQAATPDKPARKYNISKAAQKPLLELEQAFNSGDAAAFAAKLPAAEAAVKNSDERYLLAVLKLKQAFKANDNAQIMGAIDAMLASGGAGPEELPALYAKQGEIHYNNKNWEGAAASFTKLTELQPNNSDNLMNLAIIRGQQKKHSEAIQLIDRAIAAKKAAGQPVPEAWYRSALQRSYDGKLAAESAKATRALLTAYPTPENWRHALQMARRAGDKDLGSRIDALRLMRAAKALDSGDEYLALAYALEQGNFPAEAKAVIDEGVAAGKVTLANTNAAAILKSASGKIAGDKAALPGLEARARSAPNGQLAMRLADGYYGHKDYAKAIEFYRLALTKGSIDANLVNTRLGMALAMAGQKAEAEAALKQVTGARANLAGLWLLWLGSRA